MNVTFLISGSSDAGVRLFFLVLQVSRVVDVK